MPTPTAASSVTLAPPPWSLVSDLDAIDGKHCRSVEILNFVLTVSIAATLTAGAWCGLQLMGVLA